MLRLKELREEFNLTQTQLAKKIGYSQRSISNWENEIAEPSIASLIIISSFFHVSIDYLVINSQMILNEKIESKKTSSLENEILESVQQLDPDLQNQVLGYSRALQSQYERLKKKS